MESRVRSQQDRRGRGVVSVSHKVGIKLQHIITGGREDGILGAEGTGGGSGANTPHRAKASPTYFSCHLSLAEWHVLLP